MGIFVGCVKVGLGTCRFALFVWAEKEDNNFSQKTQGMYLSHLLDTVVPRTHTRPLPEDHLTFQVDSPRRAASPLACPSLNQGVVAAVDFDRAVTVGSC